MISPPIQCHPKRINMNLEEFKKNYAKIKFKTEQAPFIKTFFISNITRNLKNHHFQYYIKVWEYVR